MLLEQFCFSVKSTPKHNQIMMCRFLAANESCRIQTARKQNSPIAFQALGRKNFPHDDGEFDERINVLIPILSSKSDTAVVNYKRSPLLSVFQQCRCMCPGIRTQQTAPVGSRHSSSDCWHCMGCYLLQLHSMFRTNVYYRNNSNLHSSH